MAKNKHLRGKLPSNDNVNATINRTKIHRLIMHDMDLYGSISHSLIFDEIKYITLFNNRLSCNIPNDLVQNRFYCTLNSSVIRTHHKFKQYMYIQHRNNKSLS